MAGRMTFALSHDKNISSLRYIRKLLIKKGWIQHRYYASAIYGWCNVSKNSTVNRIDSILCRTICHKNALYECAKDSGVVPTTYILTNGKWKYNKPESDDTFFMKHPVLDSALGVTVHNSEDTMVKLSIKNPRHTYVVQPAIKNLMLHEGRKFDIRIFVAVTSSNTVKHELKFQLFRHGVLRVSRFQFDESSNDPLIQMTNACLSTKKGISIDDVTVPFDETYEHYDVMFKKIEGIATKFYETIKPHMVNSCNGNVVWLTGWDIIFDNDLNGYLIEINNCPTHFNIPICRNVQDKMFTHMHNPLMCGDDVIPGKDFITI